MSSSFLPAIFRFFLSFSDILFSGLKIVLPLLFALKLFSLSFKKPFNNNLVLSANIQLLIGGILFALFFLSDLYLSFRSEDQFSFKFMIEMATGPHWYQFALPVFNFAILPQLMWFKKPRHSVYVSFAIFLIWLFTFYFTIQMAKLEAPGFKPMTTFFKNNFSEYGKLFLVFIPAFVVIYLIVKGKNKN